MFQTFDSLGVLFEICVLVRKHLRQRPGSVRDVDSHLDEEIKVLLLFWQEINESHLGMTPDLN
jgi:hypothetical protein